MSEAFFQLAFIGPGGPEFLLVMLVLIMMFGAKDAPRILRKLNEMFSQIRNTADSFKREVMYSDITADEPSYADDMDPAYDDHDEDYDYDEDCAEGEFEAMEEDLKRAEKDDGEAGPEEEPEPNAHQDEDVQDEEGDVKKD